jgi:hypothetical protein
MDAIFDEGRFTQQLIETVRWCSLQLAADPSPAALWTVVSFPSEPLVRLTDEEREWFAHQVFEQRRLLLEAEALMPVEEALYKARAGRFFAFFTGATLSDGVSEIESQGYFNYDAYPPYDTWIDLMYPGTGDEHLICWLPPLFSRTASPGIVHSPDESLVWIDDRFPFPAETEVLRKLNIL